MFLELFNHDLNRLSWTEYQVRDEINHVRHIHLCKPVLGSGLPVDQGCPNKKKEKKLIKMAREDGREFSSSQRIFEMQCV